MPSLNMETVVLFYFWLCLNVSIVGVHAFFILISRLDITNPAIVPVLDGYMTYTHYL